MTIYKYITKKGKEIKKATIRVETRPGIAAQVDWKEDMVMHDKFGKRYQFNIFLYVLHYSKMKYITLTWDRKQDTLDLCQEIGHRKKRILPCFACCPSPSCTFKNQKVHDGLGNFVAYFFSNSMGLISFNVECTLLKL
ncbi:hypothetical protein [Staphylococcus pseudintermedius]|uniref:hypothetical protein n=1 Tax=Staphylococcus pseudintermedius TaxID=283734 RepID=UPI003F655B67